ncbi:hypothetical protein K474DRAFT_1604773 [Panus rudis PR-1116 ss-1]|nr:hypothetical protein K474DRAFT_1604773 [Panus rudis PR-1116 ss-1]
MRSLLSLPPEVLQFVLRELDQADLCIAIRLSKTFYSIGIRILYREIGDTQPKLAPKNSILLLKSLTSTRNPADADLRCSHVRLLRLDYLDGRITANLLRLLRRALSKLHALRELHLEFSLQDNYYWLAWCLHDCPAQLRVFTTSIRCDASLAAFLVKQHELVELGLRGFQTTSPFILPPTSLTKLSSFRTIHAGVAVLEEVVRGRPIDSVSISLFPEDEFSPLDVLQSSSVEIKRLTVLALDDTPPVNLFAQVASRLPTLEALHIVVLLARNSNHNLLAFAPYLTGFSALRYLTFMTGGASEVVDEEHTVIRRWAEACKTLKTIILPQGKVWFERGGQWICGDQTG